MNERVNPIRLLETTTDKPWGIHAITIDLRQVAAIEEPSPYELWQEGTTITLHDGEARHVEAGYQDVLEHWHATLGK